MSWNFFVDNAGTRSGLSPVFKSNTSQLQKFSGSLCAGPAELALFRASKSLSSIAESPISRGLETRATERARSIFLQKIHPFGGARVESESATPLRVTARGAFWTGTLPFWHASLSPLSRGGAREGAPKSPRLARFRTRVLEASRVASPTSLGRPTQRPPFPCRAGPVWSHLPGKRRRGRSSASSGGACSHDPPSSHVMRGRRSAQLGRCCCCCFRVLPLTPALSSCCNSARAGAGAARTSVRHPLQHPPSFLGLAGLASRRRGGQILSGAS